MSPPEGPPEPNDTGTRKKKQVGGELKKVEEQKTTMRTKQNPKGKPVWELVSSA